MSIEQRVESALNRAVWYRNYRRARERAMTKLAQLYPDTYKQLFEIERSIDEHQGKSWLDISGNTRVALGASAPNGHTTDTGETGISPRNDGGEA